MRSGELAQLMRLDEGKQEACACSRSCIYYIYIYNIRKAVKACCGNANRLIAFLNTLLALAREHNLAVGIPVIHYLEREDWKYR
jgi:hypothetical protein